MTYVFHERWFENNIKTWSKYLGELKDKKVNALEIGSHEGGSAI